jgi:hypothetical protein
MKKIHNTTVKNTNEQTGLICRKCGGMIRKNGLNKTDNTIKRYGRPMQKYFCSGCKKNYSESTLIGVSRIVPDKQFESELNAWVDEQIIMEANGENASATGVNFNTNETDNELILIDFLKKCKVDLKKWSVMSYRIGAHQVSSKYRDQDLVWDVQTTPGGNPVQTMEGHAVRKNEWVTKTNYNIKVNLKRIDNDIVDGFDSFVRKIPTFQYTEFKPMFQKGSGIALEIAPLDAHFGKKAWLYDTGYRNYDTRIAAKDYSYATEKHLNWAAPFKPEKIFYIIGQDLFHIDNLKGQTTYGEHALDVDGRIGKIYEIVYETVLKTAYLCRSVAPTKIIYIPGNHDALASMFLCFALYEHFRNDEFVEVDIRKDYGKITRKAELWGKTLVGWTHRIVRNHEKWVNELAQAFPQMWSDSVFREWHYGDQHKKETIKVVEQFTSGGVICRQLSALSPVDKWHFENLFTDAIPAGEAFLWSKDMGVFANFFGGIGQYESYRNELVE